MPIVGGPAELRCRLGDAVEESSGVAAASWSDKVVFTHNDSGDSARFFAVDAVTCTTRATYSISGAANMDWEDMARGAAADGTTVLWLADIGDNSSRRESIVVYEVAEPGPDKATGAVPVRARWTLTYPDGAADAETLLVDPETGRPVVVTKDVKAGRSRAYRAPAAGSGVLEPLASLDVGALEGAGFASPAWSVTGGATSPDRRAVALRTYLRGWLWSVNPGETLAVALARRPEPLELPLERQAEALSFTTDGGALWVTSEGPAAPLHLVPLTSEPAGLQTPTTNGIAPSTSARRAPQEGGSERAERSRRGLFIVLAGTVVLAAAVVLTIAGKRRPHR